MFVLGIVASLGCKGFAFESCRFQQCFRQIIGITKQPKRLFFRSPSILRQKFSQKMKIAIDPQESGALALSILTSGKDRVMSELLL